MAIGPLTIWDIPEDFPSASDYKLIILQWEDLGERLDTLNKGEPTGWDIQGLVEDSDQLKAAYNH